jgi:hypothetical protein
LNDEFSPQFFSDLFRSQQPIARHVVVHVDDDDVGRDDGFSHGIGALCAQREERL